MDTDIEKIDLHAVFRKKLLAVIKPLENDTYGIYDALVLDYSIDSVWVSAILGKISLDIISLIL